MSITREEWLQELEQITLTITDPDGMTVGEMMDSSGYSDIRLRRILRKAIESGLWEMSGKKQTWTIDKRRAWSPCYRPVEVKPCARSSSSGRKKRQTRS